MADVREARVPDIGDFSGIPVIEVLVQVGDRVAADQGLITLESDKATMEVPAPFAGTVAEIRVKVGDQVSEGDVVALVQAEEAGSDAAAPARAAGDTAPAAPRGAAADADGGAAEPAPGEGAEPESVVSAGVPVPSAAAPGASDQRQPPRPAQPGGRGPQGPPVRFDADAVRPRTVPHASPAARVIARDRSGHLHGGLVLLQRDQSLVLVDAVARFHQHFDDRDPGEADDLRHPRIPYVGPAALSCSCPGR